MRHQHLTASASPAPLVAVAHGSRDPRAAATVEDLLDLVRRRSGLRVVTSYLDHAAPTPAQAFGALTGEGVAAAVVLPLLLTAAYHSKTDIPGALAEARRAHPRLRLRYGATLGPHPLMTAALERRLAEAGVTPDADTALVLAAAGSSDPLANQSVARLARLWGTHHKLPVTAAFASASPPATGEAVRAFRKEGRRHIAVASLFLAPGFLPERAAELALEAGAVAVSEPLGAHPEIARTVLARYAVGAVELVPV